MDLAELVVRIRVMAEGAEVEMDSIIGELKKYGTETERANDKAAASWGMVTAASGAAFAGIVKAVNTGIAAAQEYQSAMMGLDSVASGRGIGGDAMQAELNKVVDAFFSASDAATAYKNLLTRGYTLDQATETITRLKDAAAFGRQANLGFAQSIVTATEGLKNENSVLVNAA